MAAGSAGHPEPADWVPGVDSGPLKKRHVAARTCGSACTSKGMTAPVQVLKLTAAHDDGWPVASG